MIAKREKEKTRGEERIENINSANKRISAYLSMEWYIPASFEKSPQNNFGRPEWG